MDYCRRENATLPVIQNPVQNEIVMKFSNYSYRIADPWLGMYCDGGDSTKCVWLDGAPVGYTNFLGGKQRSRQENKGKIPGEPMKTAPSVFMYVIDGGKSHWGGWATTYEFEPGATLCQKGLTVNFG